MSSRLVERLWLASGCLLFAGLAWRSMAILGDGFWCLAAGDLVLSTHAWPVVDVFAFASRHVPWTLHMPAFQVGGAWLVARAGLASLMVVCALPMAVAAALLWLVPARGTAARTLVLPVVLLYLLVDADDASARGQAFGDLGLVALLLVVSRLRRGDRVPFWAPIALGAVWANLHPSFLLAVALPLGVAFSETLEPASQRAPREPLVRFSALALAGACLNPFSAALVVDVLKLLVDPTTARVDLFRSPDFQTPAFLVPVALGVVLLVVLAGAAQEGRGRADAALLLAFLAAACLARRYVTALVAFEALLVGTHATRLVRATPPARLFGIAAALQAALGLACLERKDPLHDVPAAAVAAVDRLGLPERVFAPYTWGGYLEWAWGGRRKAFVDGRNQLFSNGALEHELIVEHALAGAGELLEAYEIRTVITERGGALDRAMQGAVGWRGVYRDGMAAVYVR